MKIQKLLLATMACASLAPAIAWSADAGQTSTFPQPRENVNETEWKPHVGLTAGVINPEGSFGGAVNYGVEVGFQPYVPFGAGLELSNASSENDTGETLQQTKLLARGTYNFGGTIAVIKNSYAGLAVGPVFRSDGTDLAMAPVVGFDIPLKTADRDFVSLGLSAKYLVISGGTPDSGTLDGSVKYWY